MEISLSIPDSPLCPPALFREISIFLFIISEQGLAGEGSVYEVSQTLLDEMLHHFKNLSPREVETGLKLFVLLRGNTENQEEKTAINAMIMRIRQQAHYSSEKARRQYTPFRSVDSGISNETTEALLSTNGFVRAILKDGTEDEVVWIRRN
ncbi:MAG: hypothetical protein ACD_28C00179G0004 [uncultured bacterium]|nr:MAG: hypothetical protein ACD_28C00179G0004 [uncultured bacterium]